MEKALGKQAQAKHFDDGAQGANQKQGHALAYWSLMPYSASSLRIWRL